VPAYDRVARVGREERTYNPGSDPNSKRFLRDVVGALLGSPGAAERLARHHRRNWSSVASTCSARWGRARSPA
jgi:hypothetical protein